MKNNTVIAAIAAASAILLCASCQKQDLIKQNNEISTEGKVFTAIIDQESTKTTLADDFKVNWEMGDEVIINDEKYTATPIDGYPTKATLAGGNARPITSGGFKYTAIFPNALYNKYDYWRKPNPDPYFALPAIQTYTAGKFNAPMYAESNTEAFKFKNICGVLCLSLKGNSSDKVKYITVIANEGVCGTFTVSDATTLNLSSTVGEYSRAVSLDCSHVGETTEGAGDGGVELSTTATNFYIYLPPNTYTAGMKIIITNTDGKVFEKTTSAPVTIARNNIYTFNNWTLDFQAKPALLSGEFAVADGKTVKFTRGNLWADATDSSNPVLHFEKNQWESIPTSDGPKVESHVSHFTWSDNVISAVGTKDVRDSYLFCDKYRKQTVDGQSGCYVLSKDEWVYLFTQRTNSVDKYTQALVNNVPGLIILPDTFSDPYAGIKAFIHSTEGWYALKYSEAEWIAMESEGAVFLPAAGCRNQNGVFDVYYDGRYCSSTPCREYSAYHVYFSVISIKPDREDDPAYYKWSIRLVTDIPAEDNPGSGTKQYTNNDNLDWFEK